VSGGFSAIAARLIKLQLQQDQQQQQLFVIIFCLQCFDAVGWVAGRAFGLQKN